MPIYEYECRNCGHVFSQVLTIEEHDRKKMVCPKCQSADVKHVIEAAFITTQRKS